MNILLVGHKGYVGKGLVAFWKNRHNIVGWDKEEDVFSLDKKVLKNHNIEAIVNLSVIAERTSTQYQIDSPVDSVNVQGARHLAQLLKGTKIPWFQMSTREVFGNVYRQKDIVKTKEGFRPKWLVHEEIPYHPLNAYAKSKIIAEIISESHQYSNIIRLSTCYTDSGTGVNWLIQMIKSALEGKTLSLVKAGLLFRDPMHVDDLGRLIELVVKKKIYSQKFHAGGGKANFISLLEFIQRAVPTVKYQATEGEDFGFAFDINKAYRMTGWKPKELIRDKIPIIVKNIQKEL